MALQSLFVKMLAGYRHHLSWGEGKRYTLIWYAAAKLGEESLQK